MGGLCRHVPDLTRTLPTLQSFNYGRRRVGRVANANFGTACVDGIVGARDG